MSARNQSRATIVVSHPFRAALKMRSECVTRESDNFVDPSGAFLRFCFNAALPENFAIVSSIAAAPKNVSWAHAPSGWPRTCSCPYE